MPPSGSPADGAPASTSPRSLTVGLAATPDAHVPGDVRDEDLVPLLRRFYERVEKDPALAPYFEGIDMPAHIPTIADFWSTMLFGTGRYSSNAFRPHASMPGLSADHFARWLATLEATVDDGWAGPVAERMKALAHRVAYSMQLRLGITPQQEYRSDLR